MERRRADLESTMGKGFDEEKGVDKRKGNQASTEITETEVLEVLEV